MINIDSARRTGSADLLNKADNLLPASSIAPRSFTRSADAGKPGAPAKQKLSAVSGLSPALRGLAQKDAEMRPMLNAAGSVVAVLANQKIFAEVGGDLAARAYGGIRHPRGIDIEVGNAADFDRAFGTLANLDAVAKLPQGGHARIQGAARDRRPGVSGVVELIFSHHDGRQETFLVDLLQENASEAFPNLESPNYTGRLGSPSNATVPHLIARYLSHCLDWPDTPESRQDILQIAAMIRNAGTDVNDPSACAKMSRVICAQFTPEMDSKAESKMKEVLEWMKAGDL